MAEDTAEGLKDAIRVNDGQLRGHIDEVVRSSVEETLNALLQAEADQICKACRFERESNHQVTGCACPGLITDSNLIGRTKLLSSFLHNVSGHNHEVSYS